MLKTKSLSHRSRQQIVLPHVRKMMVAVKFTTIPCEPNTAHYAQDHILFLANNHTCSKGTLYAGIKDFRTFLCVFMSFVKVSVCLKLVVNVPVCICFFSYEGLIFLSNNVCYYYFFYYVSKVVLNIELNT